MNAAVSDGVVSNEVPRSRRLWWAIEPITAVARFAPEAIETAARLGLHDPVAGHLISRLSALAPLPPRVRLAAAGWHVGPTLERTLLRRGDDVRPETLRTVQLHALDQAFWRIYGTDLIRTDLLVSASQLARRAAELADCRGRALAAAQQCLEWPTFPHLVLWQASSVLSEHRAFGRRAALIAENLTPLAGHVLDVAAGVGAESSHYFWTWLEEGNNVGGSARAAHSGDFAEAIAGFQSDVETMIEQTEVNVTGAVGWIEGSVEVATGTDDLVHVAGRTNFAPTEQVAPTAVTLSNGTAIQTSVWQMVALLLTAAVFCTAVMRRRSL